MLSGIKNYTAVLDADNAYVIVFTVMLVLEGTVRAAASNPAVQRQAIAMRKRTTTAPKAGRFGTLTPGNSTSTAIAYKKRSVQPHIEKNTLLTYSHSTAATSRFVSIDLTISSVNVESCHAQPRRPLKRSKKTPAGIPLYHRNIRRRSGPRSIDISVQW